VRQLMTKSPAIFEGRVGTVEEKAIKTTGA
jgi:hypothetical protein